MPTRLLLVRHGQTTWNAAGRWQGQADTPLTPLGEAQAREGAAALGAEADRPWTRLLASDLERARRTAETIGAALSLPVELDARFRERDVGRWSGLDHAQVRAMDPLDYARFQARDPDLAFGGAESTHDVRARALEALAEIAAGPDRAVIVVTHLGFIRSLVPDAEVGNVGRLECEVETLLSAGAPTAQGVPADSDVVL